MNHELNNQRLIDVVVVHYNAVEELRQCVAPLIAELEDNGSFSLVIVDNDTEQPALEVRDQLQHLDAVTYLPMSTNIGFGAASNSGARQGNAPFLLLLNPDCVVQTDSIKVLASTLEDTPDIVAVGPRIERPDGQPEISWARHPGFLWEVGRRRLWRALRAGRPWALERAKELISSPRDVDWLTAACLLVRRDAFERVGGFDEDYFLYFEDSDLGLRLGEQGRLRFEPKAQALHQGGGSAVNEERASLHHYRDSQRLYYAKHRPLWERIALRCWRLINP